MSLKEIKENQAVIARLSQAVEREQISHAYIFEGDQETGKLALCEAFVKAVLCRESSGDSCDRCPSCRKIEHKNHEDVIYVQASGSSIKDEAIEELQGRIKKKPYVGDRTIVILEDADTMTPRAQNRLLKTLEEPTPGTVIILLSENTENLAQTILSRCILYRLTEKPQPDRKEMTAAAQQVADGILLGRPFYEVTEKLEPFLSDREQAYALLDELEIWYRDLIVAPFDRDGNLITASGQISELRQTAKRYKKEQIYQAVADIEEARRDLNRNLNTGYALKNMILKGEQRIW